MNVTQRILGTTSFLLAAALATAQTAGSLSSPEEEIITLSPFEVLSDVRGYQATNSVSGTRINAALAELPLTINVVTSEFIRDFGADKLADALRYSAGILAGAPSVEGSGAGNNYIDSYTIRGQDVRFIYHDGVRQWRGSEPLFVDRIEIIKGPTAVLYGQALPGGTLNYLSKRPTAKPMGMIGARIDSDGGYRGEFDISGPLGKGNWAGFRVMGAREGGETWKDFEDVSRTPFAAVLEARPWQGTRISASFEFIDMQMDNPQVNGSVVWRGVDNRGGTNASNSGPASMSPGGQPIGLHPLNEPATNPYGHPLFGSYYESQSENYNLRLEQRIVEGLDLRMNWSHVSSANEARSIVNNDTNTRTWDLYDTNRNRVIASAGDTITVGGRQYVVGRGNVLAGNPIANATPGAYSGAAQQVAVFRTADGPGQVRWYGNDLSAMGLYNPNRVSGPVWPTMGGNTNTDTTWQTDVTYSFKVGGSEHRILGGFESVRGTFDQRNTSNSTEFDRVLADGSAMAGVVEKLFWGGLYDMSDKKVYDVFGRPITSTLPNRTVFNGTVTRQSSGSDSWYATYTGAFLDRRLHLLAGLRSSDLYTQNSPTSPRDEFNGNTVPQYGVLFKAAEGLSFYTSLSESFLLNNERFTTQPAGSQNPAAYTPGALFPPQEGTGLDIGVKFDLLQKKLSGNVTWFKIDRTQVGITDPNVFDQNGNNVRFPGGEEQVTGVESEVFYTISRDLQISGSVTWTDSKYTRVTRGQDYLLNLRRFNTAEWQSSLYGRYGFSEGTLKGLTVGGGVYFVGEREIDPGRPYKAEAYTVFDAFVNYSHAIGDKRLIYSLQMRNLTDKEYYQGFSGGFPPRRFVLSTRLEF